jgi:hypothetical protein
MRWYLGYGKSSASVSPRPKHPILDGYGRLKAQKVHGRECGDRGCDLHSYYLQCLFWKTREPLDREECHDGQLRSHEQLEGVGGCPFVGLAGGTEHQNVPEYHSQGRE